MPDINIWRWPCTCLLFLLCTFILCSCFSSSKKKEPEVKELVNKGLASLDSSEIELFNTGKRLFQARLYTVAKDSFQSLRDNYPLGPYREFAEIKYADCEYELNNFLVAAALYEEFTKNYPGSNALPYALLRAGSSYQLANRGLGRDIGNLEKALVNFDKLIKSYPDSIYTGAAVTYRSEVLKSISDHEQMIASFYEKKGKVEAAQARNNFYEKTWDPLLKAAQQQIDTQSHANVVPAAPEVKLELVSARRQNTTQTSPKPVLITKSAPTQKNPASSEVGYRIQKIECLESDNKAVIIYLNREFNENDWITSNRQISSSEHKLEYKLPKFQPYSEVKTCFDNVTLRFANQGTLAIQGVELANLAKLSNPARLLIVLH